MSTTSQSNLVKRRTQPDEPPFDDVDDASLDSRMQRVHTKSQDSAPVKKQRVYTKRQDSALVKAFRFIGSVIWVLLITTGMWLAAPVTFVIGPVLRTFKVRKYYYPLELLSRAWAWGVLWINDIDITVEGGHLPVECEGKSTILMYSHASNVDPITLMGYTQNPSKFIFKKELLYFVPYVFAIGMIMGHIPINRKKRQSAFESIDIAAAKVKDYKACVVISPEGTRSNDGILQPFKKGPFHMALKSGARIAPVVLFGNHEVWPTSSLLPSSGSVYVRYLPSFEIGEKDDIDSLLEKTYEMMHGALVTPPEGFEPHKKGCQIGHAAIFLSICSCVGVAIANYFGFF
ncbi:hypothetical protein SAMD00019534_107980, partial [Acytostelium subglobosum LB1]|uniref:hypothetical protein n=1 Tax=Acytostelium subglobosum LB1 TaxID=1410327 RepID=UPI000644F277